MSGHTPGPWSASEDSAHIYIIAPHAGALPGNEVALIRETYGEGRDSDKANARLIAAAPRMLSLLQQIAEEYRDTFDASCEPGEEYFSGSGQISTTTGEEVCALLATLPEPEEETR